MIPFLDENFLLQTETAKTLYHDVAVALPIIDYHCHLNPREIAEDRRFANLTEAWLMGDHYKWRAMRVNGVPEHLVTGPADEYERFLAWAGTVPMAVGNPLFHWTHLELRRYFGIDDVLTPATAKRVWDRAKDVLAEEGMSARGLIARSNVEALCTTDDPADDLKWHEAVKLSGMRCKVLPAFRPDKALNCDKPGFAAYIAQLSEAARIDIRDYDGLISALDSRIEYFHGLGCRLSDHGFEGLPFARTSDDEAAAVFLKALGGIAVSEAEADKYKTAVLLHLGRRYAERGWAMQLHMGATRNNNTRQFAALGPDTGYDAISDHPVSLNLARLLDAMEQAGGLPRTILYTLNPKDNYVLASVAGCFAADLPGKVQFGSAWWFADHIDGMDRQMRDLASIGLLSRFVGMLTDSRSFLSYTRHEYFRRILCNLLGNWVENGECPNDPGILEPIVRGVCYENAKSYFKF